MYNPSSKSLSEKLGLKPGFVVDIVNPFPEFNELLRDIIGEILLATSGEVLKNAIIYFAEDLENLDQDLSFLKNKIHQNGMIWIGWRKRSSGWVTTISESEIRELAIYHGLVDVKVCSINATWSGLKLVIPLKNRK